MIIVIASVVYCFPVRMSLCLLLNIAQYENLGQDHCSFKRLLGCYTFVVVVRHGGIPTWYDNLLFTT